MFGKLTLALTAGTGLALLPLAADADAPKSLRVTVSTIKEGAMIPTKFGFCQPAATGHVGPGSDISPGVSWSAGPKGTQSYALIFNDDDGPKSDRDKMNKEGTTIPKTAERQSVYHWVVVDIPAKLTALNEGAGSKARVVHGKPPMSGDSGKQGLNSLTVNLATNAAMKGKYYGYDGPCPPWNDDSLHHYHFTVYALSVKLLDLPADFDAAAALAALKDKVLAQGALNAVDSNNPATGAVVPKH